MSLLKFNLWLASLIPYWIGIILLIAAFYWFVVLIIRVREWAGQVLIELDKANRLLNIITKNQNMISKGIGNVESAVSRAGKQKAS